MHLLNLSSCYELLKFHNHSYSNLPVHVTAVPKVLPVVLHLIFSHVQHIFLPQHEAVSLFHLTIVLLDIYCLIYIFFCRTLEFHSPDIGFPSGKP